MISPTTILADDIVGWYTRTSTSAVTSLCPELILHTKRKNEKQMNKEWYKCLADQTKSKQMLLFGDWAKLEYPEKNLSDQRREPT